MDGFKSGLSQKMQAFLDYEKQQGAENPHIFTACGAWMIFLRTTIRGNRT